MFKNSKSINSFLNNLSENCALSMMNISSRVTDMSKSCIDTILVKTIYCMSVVTARFDL